MTISLRDVTLHGELMVPEGAQVIVIFSHGSGSSRLSPRNRMVARYLNENGLGTLLFDLLTPEEDSLYEMRFDIHLLSQRLVEVTRWLHQQPEAAGCRIAYFGASTGAASALYAAAALPDTVAVVSRGGRPDLAMDVLPRVAAPTLFIVGGHDEDVLHLNQQAARRLHCTHQLEIVGGATHLFEEKGAMEQVCDLAAKWIARYAGSGNL